MHLRSLPLPVALLLLILTPASLLAQSITPAADGTGTEVLREGDRYTITGGTQAQENLFHSFERLGLNASEIATFLAQPNIENILGRVTGGEASLINGLLQVQGSGANLYLMNPAGILFGPNARLDLSGSFLATTATGIGFGNRWFNALGDNTYANLVGEPDSFAFTLANGGAIANFADLSVLPGESLTLLGGSVTNTGSLTAPDGTLTLAAVPAGNRVRLSQAGSLLSLELEATNGRWETALNPANLTPLSLPQLLTGGNLGNASQIAVDPDGTIRLSGANVAVQDGTTLVAGTLDAAGEGAEINVLGDRVALLNANLDASGANGGGNIRVGGDYQGNGTVFNATRTFVSRDSRLTANATEQGDGGRIITWADDATRFYGTLTAQGGNIGGNGGFAEVSGRNQLDFDGIVHLSAPRGAAGQLLLDPTSVVIGTLTTNDLELLDGQIFAVDPGTVFQISAGQVANALNAGNVAIAATTNVDVNNAITATSPNSLTLTAPTINLNQGITLNGGDLTLEGNVLTPGAPVTVSTGIPGTGTVRFTQAIADDITIINSGIVRLEQGFVAGAIGIGGVSELQVAGNYLGNHNFGSLPVSLIGNTLFGGAGSTAVTFGNTLNINNFALTIQSGAIQTANILGTAGSAITLDGPTTLLGDAVLRADEIDFLNTVTGTGNLTLAAAIPATPIVLGGAADTGAGTLNLLATDLTALQDGFASITLGSANGTGAITTAGNLIFNDSLTLQSSGANSQGITLTNALNLLGATSNLTLTSTGPVTTNQPVTTQGGAIAITGNNTVGTGILTLGTIDSAGGAITLIGNSTGTGTSGRGIDIGIGGAITSNGGPISLTGTSADAEGVVIFAPINSGIGDMTVTGTSAGAGTFQGIAIAAPLTTTGGTLALTGFGTSSGIFTFAEGDLDVGAGNITLSSNSNFLPNALRANSLTLLGGGSFNLSNTANDFNTVVARNVQDLTLVDQDDINLGLSNISGSLNINSGGSITDTDTVTVTGATSLVAGANDVQLDTVSNDLGIVTVTSARNVTLNDANDIQVAVNATGSVSVNAGATLSTRGNIQGRNITLTGHEINLDNPISGSGNLVLRSTLLGQAIALGGTDNNTSGLDLTTSELSQIQPGFSAITIAGADGTGTLTLNDTSPLNGTPTFLTGFSTLVGPNTDTTWLISGSNQGQVNRLNFAGISTLQGGSGNDTFQFNTGETFTGSITGGAGSLRLLGTTVNVDNPFSENDISAAGAIVIAAEQGIRVGGITTEDGSSVTLTTRTGSIRTGDMTTAGTTGGNVTVNAETSIITGAIDASGRVGNGGNVTLDPIGDIQVDWINADGGDSGVGGTVSITAGRFFRATDAFTNRNGQQASISTAGGLGGGAITINHGGNGGTPFFVGAVSNNGSRAAITNGTDTVNSGEFFFNSVTRGAIQILTTNLPNNNEPEISPCAANCNEAESAAPPVAEETETGALEIPTVLEARSLLLSVTEQTGIPPALVYISFVSPEIPVPNDFADREAIASQQFAAYLDRDTPGGAPLLTVQPGDNDQLELMLILPGGNIVRQRVDGVTRGMVSQVRRQLVSEITAPNRLRSKRYLAPAQQLYQWLIAPLEDELTHQNIGNLAFVLDSGLRSIPLSVLHDGNQFLIERYSIGLMPSLSLTDTRYRDLRNVPILAMGASEFDNLLPLPAVPTELDAVTSMVPNSVAYLNQEFTEANLLATRYERPYGIVHLATHADFQPGGIENSYIQFGDRRLFLDALRQLRLNDPPVELLVLSACKTALGDDQAELGFGGLAVQAGVRSVLASLWYVSDTGTLSFMSEFYRQLQETPTRSEALRETQLSLLRGETRIENNQIITSKGAMSLPPELVGGTDMDLSHPYFWAAFTMIGSPW